MMCCQQYWQIGTFLKLQPQRFEESSTFSTFEVAVLIGFELAEFYVGDLTSFEGLDLVAKGGAHTADLVLFAFVDGEEETVVRFFLGFGRFGFIPFDVDALLEFLQDPMSISNPIMPLVASLIL